MILYHCEVCSYKTTVKANMKKHLKSKKHKIGGYSKDEHPYKCTHCNVTFRCRSVQRQHNRSKKHKRNFLLRNIQVSKIYKKIVIVTAKSTIDDL